jgi:hypothetical protein
MRVLVCGGRNFNDREFIRKKLDALHEEFSFSFVITGGAYGADTEGFLWAKEKGIKTYIYQAEWSRYGLSAGYVRNRKMLEEGKPDIVICFPGGSGTANMKLLALKAGVKVIGLGEGT